MHKDQLMWAFNRISAIHGVALDSLRLNMGLAHQQDNPDNFKKIAKLCGLVGLTQPKQTQKIDLSQMPFLVLSPLHGWGVIQQKSSLDELIFEHAQGIKKIPAHVTDLLIIQFKKPTLHASTGPAQFGQLARKIFLAHRSILVEAVLATAFINFLNLAASLFSMQVYDRVIPTQSSATLYVLGVGVCLVILIELAMKFARSKIMDTVSLTLDAKLSREIFQRLLNVRIDQMPGSVGSLASQIRGYEQVRSFYTASSLFAWVDVPMALLFIVVIAAIATPLVAAVPLVAVIVGVLLGLMMRSKINRLALAGAEESNKKTGLLVEAVEGVETIKAGSGGWKFLSKWLQVNSKTIHNDLQMRHSSETLGYFSSAMQQLTYSLIIVIGSVAVMDGDMTTGALIASSILSGRVLAPILSIPGLLVQQGHAKAATDGLNRLFSLDADYSGISRPLTPSHIEGHFLLKDVDFAYGKNPTAISISQLSIRPGERIGILGPVGSGKSTLLRLLSGLYKPSTGRILLDDLDLSHIDRHVLNQHIGYLQQDHRLFQGSLRDNLLIGTPDPGDQIIYEALKRTGLINLVSSHPSGLELQIQEGGKGLSGGQKQLVAFTRILLCNSDIILLDEPTASMDDEQERRCLNILASDLAGTKTLIVVTHKTSLLPLVNRLIIISGNQIVLDGPRDDVIARLAQNSPPPIAPKQSGQSTQLATT